jgi:hypothetical protein
MESATCEVVYCRVFGTPLECPAGRADADAQLLGDGQPRDAGCPRRDPNSAVMNSLVNSYQAQDRIGLVTELLIGGLKQQTVKVTSRWFKRSHSQPPIYGAFCHQIRKHFVYYND